jgi:hypothetical protein
MVSFVALCLAVYGLAWLMVDGVGPEGILSRMRYKIGVRYNADGSRYGLNWAAELLNCEICTSVWICVPLALVTFLLGWWWIAPLSAVGFVAVYNNLFDNIEYVLKKVIK